MNGREKVKLAACPISLKKKTEDVFIGLGYEGETQGFNFESKNDLVV
jgi:hypothetical protein